MRTKQDLSDSIRKMKDKIDTQGMGGTVKKSSITKPNLPPNEYGPFPVKHRTVFTDMEREELKEIIREVLDEYFPE